MLSFEFLETMDVNDNYEEFCALCQSRGIISPSRFNYYQTLAFIVLAKQFNKGNAQDWYKELVTSHNSDEDKNRNSYNNLLIKDTTSITTKRGNCCGGGSIV